MGQNFVQEDSTTTTCGAVQACAANSLASVNQEHRATVAATPGSTGDTGLGAIDSGVTAGVVMYECAPNQTDWAAGTAVVRVNVGVGNMQLDIVAIYLCQRSSACGAKATYGSLTSIGQNIGTAQVYSFNVTCSAITALTSDLLYIVVEFAGQAGMSQTCGITPSETIDTPISTGGQDVSVGAIAAGTTINEPQVAQTVPVPAISAATTMVAPTIAQGQTVAVPAMAAGTAIVEPSQINQTVPVPAMAAVAAIPAPVLDRTIPVPAIPAGSAIIAPTVARVVDIPVMAAGTAILAPPINQTVPVPAMSAATAIIQPVLDRTIPVEAITAGTAIPAPTIDAGAGNQNVAVAAISAGTAIVTPQVDQTVPIPSVAAGTAILAPQVDQTVDVSAMAAGTAIPAPTQVDQTVPAPAIGAGTAIVAPTQIDQTVIVPAISAATAIIAPTISVPGTSSSVRVRGKWSKVKPPNPVLHTGHGLAKGLILFCPLMERTISADAKHRDLSLFGRDGTPNGLASGFFASPYGNAIDFPTIDPIIDFGDEGFIPKENITFMWVGKADGTVTNRAIFGHDVTGGGGNDQRIDFSLGADATEARFKIRNSELIATGIVWTDWSVWICTIGSRGMEIWKNGIKVASNGTTTTVRVPGGATFTLGENGGFRAQEADHVAIAVWDHQLPLELIQQLTLDPWEVIRPSKIIDVGGAAAGGDQNVSVGAIAAGTAIVAPQVDQTVDVPAVGAGTAIVEPQIDQTVPIPAIAAGTAIPSQQVAQTVPVPAISAATTMVAPAIAQGQTVAVDAIAAGTAMLAPVVDQTVNVGAVPAATASPAPTIAQGQTVAVAAMSVGTAILAPTLDRTIPVPAMAAATAALAPQVDQTVNVGAMSATAVIPAPTVAQGQTVAVGPMAAGTAVVAPQIDQTVPVGTIPAATASPAPAVAAGQDVAVPAMAAGAAAPAPAQVAQTVPVPAIPAATAIPAPVLDRTIPVPAIAAAAASPAPAQVSQTVDVPVMAAVTASPAPTVITGKTIAVEAIAAGTAILAPVLDRTIPVPAIAAGTSSPAPTVGRIVEVPSIAAGTASPAPDQVQQTVPVPPMAAATVSPAPSIVADQNVAVAAIAARAVVIAPSVTFGQVINVPAMPAATAFPAPVVEVLGPFGDCWTKVASKFNTDITIGASVETQFDNMEFQPSGSFDPTTDEWVRFQIRFTKCEFMQSGGPKGSQQEYRIWGEAICSIRSPVVLGEADGRVIADLFVTKFRRVVQDGVYYRNPGRRNDARREGAWWIQDYICLFYCDFDEDRNAHTPATVSPKREDVPNILISRYIAKVATPLSLPTLYDNQLTGIPNEPYVLLLVNDGSSLQLDSRPGHRTIGIMTAEVNVPVETGTFRQLQIADAIATAFRAVSEKGVTCTVPFVRTVNTVPGAGVAPSARDGSWWMAKVVIPFYFSEQ